MNLIEKSQQRCLNVIRTTTFKSRRFKRQCMLDNDVENFLKSDQSSHFSNLTRESFAKMKTGQCGICLKKCARTELAHLVHDRPTLVRMAYEMTSKEKHKGAVVVCRGEMSKNYVNLHVKYPVCELCHECHVDYDSKKKPKAAVGPVMGDDIYEYERILDRRKRGRGEQVLVKWRGYDETQATWEPASNIIPKSKLLTNWERIQKRRLPKKTVVIQEMIDKPGNHLNKVGIKRAWTNSHHEALTHAMTKGGFKLVGKRETFGVDDELKGEKLDPYTQKSVEKYLQAVERYPARETIGNGYLRASLKTLCLVHQMA